MTFQAGDPAAKPAFPSPEAIELPIGLTPGVDIPEPGKLGVHGPLLGAWDDNGEFSFDEG